MVKLPVTATVVAVIPKAPSEFNAIPPLPASNSMVEAFTSTLVDKSFPTVIVLSPLLPILMALIYIVITNVNNGFRIQRHRRGTVQINRCGRI